MSTPRFSLQARALSFRYAWEGLRVFFRTQHNAWIQASAAACAVAAGFACGIDRAEWCALIAAIALVFVAEMSNTAIELLCDVVHPERHPGIKKVKDVAAGAVLVAALAAAGIGAAIFLPRLLG